MEGTNQQNQKKKSNKIIPIIVAVAVILIAGIITTQALLKTSGKEDYFLAEKNTIEQLQSAFEARYEDEIAWAEHANENAVKSVLELTAEANHPELASMGYDQIINNANVTIESAMDKKEKAASTNISAGFSGIELNGIEGYINENELYVGLPFLEDIIKLNGDDLGRILHEMDPATFTGEENIDFSQFFADSSLMTEDMEYLKEEYLEYLYNEIPEDAFESAKENVSVGGSDISAEKITFQLSEDEVKTMLKDLFNKMAKDEKLKEIIISQISYSNFASPALAEEEIATFKEDYVTGLEEAAKEIEDVRIPDGFTSIIWVNDDIIVKRELSFAVGNNVDDTTAGIKIEGTNAVSDSVQQIDYAITFDDGISEDTVNITADLSHQDGETKDTVTFTAADLQLALESTQTKKDAGKSFEHILSVEEDGQSTMSIHWLGEGNYEEDQMTVDHTFFINDGVTFNQDVFSLFVKETGSTIEKVEVPSSDNVKNLSDMSGEEIIQYFETDVMSQFQGWMMNMTGAGF